MKRRWLRFVVSISAALALPILGAFILLQTPLVNRFLMERARDYLHSKSGMELSASQMNLNPLGRSVTLENVVVKSAQAPDLPPFFKASRIYARLSVLNTIREPIALEELQITTPQINCFVRRDGKNNYPASSGRSGNIPDFLITHASLGNGSFRFENQSSGVLFDLPLWQLSLNGNRITFDHRIDFTTQRAGSFGYRGRTASIDYLKLLGTLQKKAVQIERAQLRAAGSQVSASGSIKDFSSLAVDLQLEPDLDLNSISPILGLEKPVQGAVTGKIWANGKLQDLQIVAQIKGTNINALEYRQTSFDLKTRAEWNSRRLFLRNLKLDSPEGSVSGNAELYPGTEPGTNSIEAELKNFNINPFWKQVKPPFDIASRTSGRFSLSWKSPLKVSTIAVNAHLNLVATRNAPARSLLPISGTLDAQMRSGRMTGNLRAFSLMGAQMDGTFSLLSFETVDANIHGTIPNIDTPLTQVPQFIGNSGRSLVGIRMAGSVQFGAQAGGKLSNPRIRVSADAPDLQVDELKNIKAKTEATIQNSTAAFQMTATLPQDSTVLANGVLGFGGRKTTLNLNASTRQMPANAVPSMLGSSLPVAGTLNADLHLDGPLDDFTGNASLTGDQVSVLRQPIGHFDIVMRIAGGEIRSDPFRIIRDPQNPGTNYIDAQFTYGLDSEQFQFKATGKDLTWNRLILPGGKALEGTASLLASGNGTLADPSIDLSLESREIRLEQNTLGPVSVSAGLRGEQATIDAKAPHLNLSLNGRLATRSPYQYDGELQIRNPDLSILGFKTPNKEPLTGTIEAAIQASGNLNEAAGSRVSAQIQKLELRAGNLEVHTDSPIRAEYQDRSIEMLTPATVISGDSRLEIAGRVPLQQTGASGTLTLKGQIDLTQTAGFLPVPEGFDATGKLNLDVSLLGTPQKMSAAGTITLDNGIVHLPRIATPLSDIAIRASLQDGALVLQRADAALGEGRIALDGEFPFGLLPKNIPVQFPRKEGPARFALDLSNFKPEITGLLPQGFGGLISVHVTGQAESTNLRTLGAEIVFRDLNFKANEVAIGQDGPSTILVRNGMASISKLSLTGSETSIVVTGSAALFRDGPINLRLTGNFDAALLTLLTGKDIKPAGRMQVQATAGGDWRTPGLSGIAEMNGGRLTLRNPRVVADSLTVRLDLTPSQIAVREFKGTLNGGSITMDGTIGYHHGALDNFDLKATLQDVFLDFPEGFKSASNGNLTITSSDESIVIGGTVRVLESSFREPFEVAGPLMSYLKSEQVVVGSTEPNPLLNRIRFNIGLRTITPLLVQNNIAKVEASGNLRVVGSFYEPSLVGRITLDQGGNMVLNQRIYYIERGIITLNNQSQIKPELDIEAQTKVDTYQITMRLTGPPERLSTTLTSEPSLQEQDIISLLLTGKTSSESTQQVAQTQALSLIAGQAGEEVTREARQALHLSTLRIDPSGLMASESDLGARLTIGQDITRDLSLAYSMDLVESGKQIWAAEYKVTRRLTTQATKQEDNSYRFEFRHDMQFGGTPTTRRSQTTASKFRIGSIRFEGVGGISDKVLMEKLKLKQGDRYDFPKVQKGLDRLRDLYAGQRRLEADVRLHRETQQNTVDLDVIINPGPVVEFLYEGMPLSSDIKEGVEKAWKNGVFDIERIDDAVTAIRRPLLREGFLQVSITNKIDTESDKKVVRFHIEPGTRYAEIPVLFTGASEITAVELSNALGRAKLGLEVYADPQKVSDYIKRYYYDRGYIQASVDLPQPRLDPKTGTGEVWIPVHEGLPFTIGNLEFSGNSAFTYDQLWVVIPTSTGSLYNAKSLQDSARALESLYHNKGYNEVSVTHRVMQDSKTAQAHVTFLIAERLQSIIREIEIEGNEDTSRNFLLSQLEFKAGDVLDLNRIDETRKRLYSTGVYSSIDFQNEELPGPAPNSREKNIRVRIRVRETRPYRLQYGLFYDTDRGPGGLLEVQHLNFLGRASALGMKLRYDSDLKEARLYFNQPFIKNNFLKTDASAFAQQENRPAFDAKRIGFSLIRENALPRKYFLDYGYRYDHVRWNGLPDNPTIFQASVPVARLIATVTRDIRDSILDATKGEFTSHSLEFGPRFLGSEIGFTRYSGQYFRYVPLDKFLGKPTKDREGKPIAASLVYAGALRLGLTSAFGESDVISPERFFAGGGTTMRGFQQDMLGPTETVIVDGEPTQRPVGGEAMFLFNNEIRFPIIGILQGVGFVDIGNVYRRISDFDFSMRKTAGFGLRIKIKFVPLRFDYGFKLDRRPGESAGAFFFSIGQAF
jgi:outer membrane protein assembly complex protein YaeT